MKKLFITVLGCFFASSAMSVNWVPIHTNTSQTIFSIDTSRINIVPTRLSTTGEVRSAWIRADFAKENNGVNYIVTENYIKCKEFKEAVNTLVGFKSNGESVKALYDVSGPSADFASYKSIIPGTVSESVFKTICALTAH